MSEIPLANPEKKEKLDDNARKFIVDALDPAFLVEHNASSFILSTDWLETGENEEKKLAHKKFVNGDVQILLIAKVMRDGKRTSEKLAISEDEYHALLASSLLSVKKQRHEFTYGQGTVTFSMKYDEFADSSLRILEVDAKNDEARNSFTPNGFPSQLTEVTGNTNYYGYRVAGVI